MSNSWHKSTGRCVWRMVTVLVVLAFATMATACNIDSGDDFTPPPATIIRSEEANPTATAVQVPTPTETRPTPPTVPSTPEAEQEDYPYPLPTPGPTYTPEAYD